MKTKFLFFILFLLASNCVQTENSQSDDATATGSPQFLAVVAVMRTNCFACHDEFTNKTEQDLADKDFFIPGDAENSKLYYRLRNSTGPNGGKDMPPVGALSADDLEKFKTWINGSSAI